LLRIADDLSQHLSSATLIARRLLKSDCLKCILGLLKAHNKVEHIKSALLLLTTLTSVSQSTAAEVMTHFDVINGHLLKLLYRKHVSQQHLITLCTLK
jgi:Ribosome 60S biogenesis N-terminal